MPTGNRLLPLLVGLVVVMLGFVAIRSCSGDPQGVAVMQDVPLAPVPDADTPADTIKTLTANVAAMTSEVQTLRLEGQRLQNENRTLLEDRARVEENIMARVRREWRSHEQSRVALREADSGKLASLAERIDALSQALVRAGPREEDLPVGEASGRAETQRASRAPLVWIDPLDGAPPSETDLRLPDTNTLPSRPLPALFEGPDSSAAHKPVPVPAYTVPRNATLLDSTALTALVGRVPVQGQVRDPMPFKVITGAQNLAANGFTVAGVRGMVWSGTAIGDWTLSCITGRLDSVTFVFDDGTIRTISAESGDSLGWISDAQGFPCIGGERKTNAPAFLSQRIAMTAIQAAADAAAAAQTTTRIDDHGMASGQVTGDTGAFVLGKTVSGGSDAVARWLMERQSQSFDAVFAPAGVRLAIHVDHELSIDLDPEGRRLDYANMADSHHLTRLD